MQPYTLASLMGTQCYEHQRGWMHHQRRGNMNIEQDLEEHWDSMSSRLKLNFRSTSCSIQSFPSVFNPSLKESLLWELQELILAYVPALKLLELKAVCRSWRDLLQSSSFKEKWQLMRGGCGSEMLDVWVMQSEQEDLIAYVPAIDKYYLFLSLICSSFVLTRPAFNFKIHEVSFICACGPAIVLANKNWRSHPCFFMYDSHTCQRFRIEVFLGRYEDSIAPSSFPVLIKDKDQSRFFLAVETQSVSENRSHLVYQLCIYKFTTLAWTSFPRSSAVQADFSDMSAVLCGDVFQYDQQDSTLYAWSVQNWSKVQITFSDGALPSHDMMNSGIASIHNTNANAFKVVKCEGHILLITSTVQWEGGVGAQCFTIWKLMKGAEESVTWNWFKISRTPPELCLKSFNQESFLHPTSMCDGHCICIMSSSREFFPALVYDVKHGSWYHLHGVLKDMRALFAMKLRVPIDNL